jgi:hypothetical protein
MVPVNLDPHAIRSAQLALDKCLRAEAEQQQAYLFHFPDGRVSVELEWVDLHPIVEQVVRAYVAFLERDQLPAR